MTPGASRHQHDTPSRHERLDELAKMEDGWYWHDEGKAPTALAIEIARSFVDAFGPTNIYPTLAGGISIEADANGYCWSITIGPRGGVTVFADDLRPLGGVSKDATP